MNGLGLRIVQEQGQARSKIFIGSIFLIEIYCWVGFGFAFILEHKKENQP